MIQMWGSQTKRWNMIRQSLSTPLLLDLGFVLTVKQELHWTPPYQTPLIYLKFPKQ